MAHRGREYKRWRRLDFSVTADRQRNYWPESFRCEMLGAESAFWKLNRFKDIDTYNLSMCPDGIPRWESNETVTTPAGLRVVVSWPAFEGSGTLTFHYAIQNELDFKILETIQEANVVRNDYTGYNSSKTLAVLVKDSAIDIPTGNLSLILTFNEYNRYNP